MGLYDASISVPVTGQIISVGSYGVPVRNAILSLDSRLSVREAAEALPAAVSAAGGTGNTVTSSAGGWNNVGPNGAAVSITNPSSAFNLVCMVYFGAWMAVASGGGDVRCGVNITGGVTSDPNPGANSPVGYGLMPLTSLSTAQGGMGMFQLIIPAGAGAVTLTMQNSRSVTNASTCNYPAINVIPWRYE